jgi:hypothetical protein
MAVSTEQEIRTWGIVFETILEQMGPTRAELSTGC